MRYTLYRGLTQVTNWVKLKFAAMNLKKQAIWNWRDGHPLSFVWMLHFFAICKNNPTFDECVEWVIQKST
jgi:hypothetical protein